MVADDHNWVSSGGKPFTQLRNINTSQSLRRPTYCESNSWPVSPLARPLCVKWNSFCQIRTEVPQLRICEHLQKQKLPPINKPENIIYSPERTGIQSNLQGPSHIFCSGSNYSSVLSEMKRLTEYISGFGSRPKGKIAY